MKRIVTILAFALLLTGCTITRPYSFENFSIDLRSVEKQGIFITTGDISNKEYKTAGFVITTCYPGYEMKSKSPKTDNRVSKDDIYSSAENPVFGSSNHKNCSYDEMFSALVDQTKVLNANAIIKLEVSRVSKLTTDGKSVQWGVQVQGLAVQIVK